MAATRRPAVGLGLLPPGPPVLFAPVARPDFPAGALPDTGRLWARLLSLALWPGAPAEAVPGLGLFPPAGVFFWSCAIVPQSPIRGLSHEA